MRRCQMSLATPPGWSEYVVTLVSFRRRASSLACSTLQSLLTQYSGNALNVALVFWSAPKSIPGAR